MIGRRAAGLLAIALTVGVLPLNAWAQDPGLMVQEGIGIGGSVTNSTISNTINQENPATLAGLVANPWTGCKSGSVDPGFTLC